MHIHITFYFLSSLHSYCMSIFYVTCFMSLAYLLSILLLYSCFYTLQIPYSFYNLLFSCSITYSFIYFCTFHVTFSFVYCTCSYTFRVLLYFTSCSCNCILSLHSSAMLLISCHIFSTFHLHIPVIFFYVSCLHKP